MPAVSAVSADTDLTTAFTTSSAASSARILVFRDSPTWASAFAEPVLASPLATPLRASSRAFPESPNSNMNDGASATMLPTVCPHVALLSRSCSARYRRAAMASSSVTASPFEIFLNVSDAVMADFIEPPTSATVVRYGTKFFQLMSAMASQKPLRSPLRLASMIRRSARPLSVFSSCSRDMVRPNTLADFTYWKS